MRQNPPFSWICIHYRWCFYWYNVVSERSSPTAIPLSVSQKRWEIRVVILLDYLWNWSNNSPLKPQRGRKGGRGGAALCHSSLFSFLGQQLACVCVCRCSCFVWGIYVIKSYFGGWFIVEEVGASASYWHFTCVREKGRFYDLLSLSNLSWKPQLVLLASSFKTLPMVSNIRSPWNISFLRTTQVL